MFKLKKDTRLLVILLLTSFISVYFLPELINKVVFIFILGAAFYTKLDYVYLVWFFIINDAPGRLFSVSSAIETMRIPFYSFGVGISFSFQDLFLLVLFLKVMQMDKKLLFVFKKPIIYFYLFAGLIMVYSLFLGMSIGSFLLNLRLLLPWAFLFIIPYFITNKYILLRVSFLIFPVVFVGLASQIFSYLNGSYFDNVLRGAGPNKFLAIDADENASRSYSNVYIGFVAFINALYFFYNRSSGLRKNYIALVVFAAVFSSFLTATRGFILAYFVMIIGVVMIFGFLKEFFKVIRLSSIALLFLLIILIAYPVVSFQIQRSFDRFLTIESLVQGDITAGGTLGRLDLRAPKVMKKFWEKPILGWGFSDEYHKFGDGHIGNHNLLLNVGIVGFLFLLGIYFRIIFRIFKYSKNFKIQQVEGKAPLIYGLAFVAVFVIHSTSTQFWGYLLEFNQIPKILCFAFLLTSINVILMQPTRSTIFIK